MMTAAEVPEDKIKEMVATGLTRMRRDGALPKTTDPIPDIIKRLFPSPGTFDEAEFAKVVDVADRKQIYMSAADAESKLTPADKTKLISAMGRADLMLIGAEGDAANIKRVFGTRAATPRPTTARRGRRSRSSRRTSTPTSTRTTTATTRRPGSAAGRTSRRRWCTSSPTPWRPRTRTTPP